MWANCFRRIGWQPKAARPKAQEQAEAGCSAGHAGHHRQLVPAAEVSAIEVLLPKQCGHCGGSLPQTPARATMEGEPRRHQVTEVPPGKAHITEYQFPNVVCGQCGKTTHAPLPEEIAGQFGPLRRTQGLRGPSLQVRVEELHEEAPSPIVHGPQTHH